MSGTNPDDQRSYWSAWERSWDQQQQRMLPDREERIEVLLGLVGEIAAAGPVRVLDLACGCASISRRLLAGFPEARSVAADLDPLLLRIAAGSFAGDLRLTLVETDLREPDWSRAIPGAPFDAVLSATALHWLEPTALAAAHRQVARLLRPGGLFADADEMPLGSTPNLNRAVAALAPLAVGEGELWDEWWERVGRTPELAELLQERNRRFGGAVHPAEFTPDADWHLESLSAAGFSESAVVWRRGRGAVVAALR